MNSELRRRLLEISGRTQGVGFRPWVYALAARLGIAGSVANSPEGVRVEAEGGPEALAEFERALASPPPPARVDRILARDSPSRDSSEFVILPSETGSSARISIPPDFAVCAECRAEMDDPQGRRFGHPFINCSRCGPRHSIVAAGPYDRVRTSMAAFPLCADCLAEYGDRAGRRHHCEPNSCLRCGPSLRWIPLTGRSAGLPPLEEAAAVLRSGGVAAVKGVGGFHLMALASRPEALDRIRRLKRRPSKPLALMFLDLKSLEREAFVESAEREALLSPAAPVVLLRARPGSAAARAAAPGCPWIGAMLAHAPVQILLLREAGGEPVAATSCNPEGEPIHAEASDTTRDFGSSIDGILDHDRAILRRQDDSIVRLLAGKVRPLRLGRGLAPAEIALPPAFAGPGEHDLLAFGGHEKASLAARRDGRLILSQHLGDLDSPRSREAFNCATEDFVRLHGLRPRAILCDAHPDYASSAAAADWARSHGAPLVPVFHHAAHFHSALAEVPDFSIHSRGIAGLAWDGTGLGADGTVWGAETLLFDPSSPGGVRRLGSIRPFPLIGVERAVREPWRVALALLAASGIDHPAGVFPPDRTGQAPSPVAFRGVASMAARGSGGPACSSLGRIFDAVASILGIRHFAEYSAQPAMELEWLAESWNGEAPPYPLPLEVDPDGLLRLDWRPMIAAIWRDRLRGVPLELIAARFHSSWVDGGTRMAVRCGARFIALSGGCFQNAFLAGGLAGSLCLAGVEPFLPLAIPVNDGGLAAGQIFSAAVSQAVNDL